MALHMHRYSWARFCVTRQLRIQHHQLLPTFKLFYEEIVVAVKNIVNISFHILSFCLFSFILDMFCNFLLSCSEYSVQIYFVYFMNFMFCSSMWKSFRSLLFFGTYLLFLLIFLIERKLLLWHTSPHFDDIVIVAI